MRADVEAIRFNFVCELRLRSWATFLRWMTLELEFKGFFKISKFFDFPSSRIIIIIILDEIYLSFCDF